MRSYYYIILAVFFLSGCGTTSNQSGESQSKELNIYSHRHYDADKLVFGQFEEQTGIKVNLVRASADELITRMEMEGEKSPADVLITVDAAKLNRAKQKDLLQTMEMAGNPVPATLRDPENYWTAITFRARVIAYDKRKVDPSSITTYQDLADPKWDKKVLIRSSGSVYNQSLLASIIYNQGEEGAREWAAGIVSNMAREPKGGDRDQVKAIASGVGELAVVNTYYVGLLLNSTNEEELTAGQKIGLIFPNQASTGTHINISGIGITKTAPNKENAKKFIEFLLSDEVQKVYASNSFEYPASANVSADSTVANWGKFKFDDLSYADSTYYSQQAIKIFDEVGWN